MTAEFTIEQAAPPACHKGGRGIKSMLRQNVERLHIGQVLRWRGEGVGKVKMDAVVHNVRRLHCDRAFTTRKVDGGFDIYRTE